MCQRPNGILQKKSGKQRGSSCLPLHALGQASGFPSLVRMETWWCCCLCLWWSQGHLEFPHTYISHQALCMSPSPSSFETWACPPHLHPIALVHVTFSWADTKMMATSLPSLTQTHMLCSCSKPFHLSPSIMAEVSKYFL